DQPATFAAVKGLRDPQAPTRAAAAAALGEAALAGNSVAQIALSVCLGIADQDRPVAEKIPKVLAVVAAAPLDVSEAVNAFTFTEESSAEGAEDQPEATQALTQATQVWVCEEGVGGAARRVLEMAVEDSANLTDLGPPSIDPQSPLTDKAEAVLGAQRGCRSQ
ncbi:unnamed protein product, partial [Effrenium voratum]